jgi:hypothetical protein
MGTPKQLGAILVISIWALLARAPSVSNLLYTLLTMNQLQQHCHRAGQHSKQEEQRHQWRVGLSDNCRLHTAEQLECAGLAASGQQMECCCGREGGGKEHQMHQQVCRRRDGQGCNCSSRSSSSSVMPYMELCRAHSQSCCVALGRAAVACPSSIVMRHERLQCDSRS